MAFSSADRQKFVAPVQTLHSSSDDVVELSAPAAATATVPTNLTCKSQNEVDNTRQAESSAAASRCSHSLLNNTWHRANNLGEGQNGQGGQWRWTEKSFTAEELQFCCREGCLASGGASGCFQEQLRQRGLGSPSLFHGLCGEVGSVDRCNAGSPRWDQRSPCAHIFKCTGNVQLVLALARIHTAKW